MMFKMTPEARARVEENAIYAAERRAEFAALDNDNLVASARLWMSFMTPMNFAPGEPVYDATMWHVILPELLRRLAP